ncbi:hypothetical protein Tco_1515672 [Tanacetum coccineum]
MKPGEEKSKVVELTLRCSRDDPRRILVESLGKVVETQYESLVELFGIRWEEKHVESAIVNEWNWLFVIGSKHRCLDKVKEMKRYRSEKIDDLKKYLEMINLRNSNQDPPVDLYDLKGSDEGDNKIDPLTMELFDTFLMGDKVISTTPERENDEFINSSVDDLVPIPKESEVTSINDDLECDIPATTPLPTTDFREENLDIDLLLGEHLDTLSTGDKEIDFDPIRDIEELERLLADDPVPVPSVFDAPLGHSDLISRLFDMTFSNPLFDFNDDSTLCNDNPLFDEEFEDISSLDPPEWTPVIDESSLLVTPLPDPKQI